jgi:3-deoxy-7-phosphoheptulonate synthase/chorismate mutase
LSHKNLEELRKRIRDLNLDILDRLNQRAYLVKQVQQIKTRESMPAFSPERELDMLNDLAAHNQGPFSNKTIGHLFKEIFRASLALTQTHNENTLRISRQNHQADLRIHIKKRQLGGKNIIIAGPCAVESVQQMEQVALALSHLGISILRGGTFKPRSSPYAFQGLGEAGLKILADAANRNNMLSATEVMDTRLVEKTAEYVDILQVGTRNMHNYSLLREVGRCSKPVILKRGMAATLEEFLWAAEYIVAEGNQNVILCERGIRTFENQTRNTLDISAIPLLRQKTYLPVIADVSHAAGRKDILAPLAKAVLAAGANGFMVEVHPQPAVARSDSQQQLDIEEFKRFLNEIL